MLASLLWPAALLALCSLSQLSTRPISTCLLARNPEPFPRCTLLRLFVLTLYTLYYLRITVLLTYPYLSTRLDKNGKKIQFFDTTVDL